MQQLNELALTSTHLPGGNLVSAIMDRVLMRLSDRGGASGLIGDRWAALCAHTLSGWIGGRSGQPGQNGATMQIEHVVRLDDRPHVASIASRKKLQSPDFLILGRVHGEPVIQAADAKFSVETARSRQVSPQVLADLFANLPEVTAMLSARWIGASLAPGMFLCPDYPLTAYMLRGQRGLRRVTVHAHEVALVPVAAEQFTAPLPGAHLIPLLHELDHLPLDPTASLLASLYYFRLVRACVTCWIEETRPLLGFPDRPVADYDAVQGGLRIHGTGADSAFGAVMAWQRHAASVQEDRNQVEHAAALPIAGKDLRALIATLCGAESETAPSANQVRKNLGSWYRAQLLAEVGPVNPPVADLAPVVRRIRSVASSLREATQDEAVRVIATLHEERIAAANAGTLHATLPEL